MGNQVNCPFNGFEDTLNYRLAYSFVAGDSLTLVLDLDKTFLPNWGFKANDNANNREVTLTFIKNLTNFYNNGGKKYLYNARRTICKPIKCDTVSFSKWCDDKPIVLPRILTCAYEINGTKTQLLCNPFNENIVCEIDNKSITVPALSVITVNI
jgi:hypothetical protein